MLGTRLYRRFAARQWDAGKWTNDLHQLPFDDEERLILPHELESHYAWPEAVPQAPLQQELTRVPAAPKQGGGVNARRGHDRWKIAVERLERAGHDDVAQQVAEYRNARNERAGWDAWLKSNFPALWKLLEEGE